MAAKPYPPTLANRKENTVQTVSAEKTFQGAWRVSAIVNGYLVSRQYFDATKHEAIRAFKTDIKEG